jgi:hypothetical protein
MDMERKPQEDRKDETIPSRKSDERRVSARPEELEEDEVSRSPKLKSGSLMASAEKPRLLREARESFDEDELSPSTSQQSKRSSFGISKSNSTPSMPTQSKKKWRMSLRKDSQKENDIDKGEKKRLREEAKHQLNLKPSSSSSGSKVSPSVNGTEENIMCGWMKMRNSMKIWVNRWWVLRPGKLIYFRDEKVWISVFICLIFHRKHPKNVVRAFFV